MYTAEKILREVFANVDFHLLLRRSAITLVTILIIFVLFNVVKIAALRIVKGKIAEHRAVMLRKAFQYCAWIVVVLFVCRSLGIDSSAILGAAGIAGVALGFASQTSMSNLISGLFLLSEKPCQVGDIVTVDGTTGIVLSIDLLSVKLRTFDNLFIRIPNETIIKTNLVNITRFPVRRLEVAFNVPHTEDITHIRETLSRLAAENVYCLQNPAPLFLLGGIDTNGVNISFFIWFDKSKFIDVKNSFIETMLSEFKKENITFSAQRIVFNQNKAAL